MRIHHLAFVAVLSACAATAHAQAPTSTPRPSANELVVSYLAAWNERDPVRRRDLVNRTWADTGTYADPHRHGEGPAAIDAMIATAQARYPNYRMRLVSSIEAQNRYVRFGWAAGGAADAPLYLAGTDFFVLGDDGRVQSVAGFVDATPAH